MAFKMKKFGKITVDRAPLDSGVVAEARNDGTIVIDANANLNKKQMNRVIKHEMKHMQDMEEGRADYGDNWVMWDDKIYIRKSVDGVSVIDGPNGRWPEGHPNHPWEAEAIAVEQATVAALKQEEKKNKKEE